MLLELLIDPTSSIIFQRIKPSLNIMSEKPRNIDEPILNLKTTIKSISQGILIFIVTFITYLYLIKNNIDTKLSITITYSILVLSIILIAYQLKSNNSTIKSFLEGLKDKISLMVNTTILLGLLLLIYIPFLNKTANTHPLELKHWIYIILLTLIAVLPFDIMKINKIKNLEN